MRIDILRKSLSALELWMPHNVDQQSRLILVRGYCFLTHLAQSKIKRNLETKAAFRRRSIGTYSEHIMIIGFGVARRILDVARRLHATDVVHRD